MEIVDQDNHEKDGTYQFLQYLSLPAEPCDRGVPPKKWKKIENQTSYPINRIAAEPKYINIEPSEIPISRKKEYSFSSLNATYSNEMGNDCPSVGQRYFSSSVWDIVDPQGSVRGLTASAPKTPAFSTDMVSPYKKKSSLGKRLTPIVYCNCTLHPPPNGNVPKPTMERPLGCKTVIISGLPNSLSYEMLKKVFGYCGKIRRLVRKKKDSFFRVTYLCESSIDKVLELNGYTLESSNGKESLKGIIKVNYAKIWAERLDYISQMEAKQKEKPFNEPILKPNCKESNASLESSGLISKFSSNGIRNLLKEIHGDGHVNFSSNTLIRWMEEGDCKRKNCDQFFNVLSAMHSSVSRFMNDAAKLKESVRQQQGSLQAKYTSNSLYFVEIMKVFHAATSKTVFNIFSPNMRPKIEVWKKYIEDIIESNSWNMISAVVKNKSPVSKISAQNSLTKQQTAKLEHLKVENERLKKELRVAQREASKRYNDQIPQKSDETKSEARPTKNSVNDNINDNVIKIVEKEAHIIAMIGAFLSCHGFGESIENICRYLLKIDSTVTSQDIECLMRKLPTVFKEESVEGADDSKTKWTVCRI